MIRILVGDCRESLKTMEAQSVHCVVTSPPYWGLRCYGVDGQLGLESTPEEHVAVMVDVFRDVWRVLRDDGTCWVNYGDCYAASVKGSGGMNSKQPTNKGSFCAFKCEHGLKPKDLVGMPWRVAFALQADGWYLRSDIIWKKPNPMPESVTDRPTKAHEYVFLLTKKPKYFYDADAVREANSVTTQERVLSSPHTYRNPRGDTPKARGSDSGTLHSMAGRNLRTVWTIPTHPFPGAHFATFPPKLVEPCIKAGTSEHGVCGVCGAPWVREVERELQFAQKTFKSKSPCDGFNKAPDGHVPARSTTQTTGWRSTCEHDDHAGRAVVLDPFGGAGTVGLVADRLQRDAVLCELNEEYAEMARKRLRDDCPMFTTVEVE